MMATPLAVTVLISGRGSNMEAIARAGIAGRIPARVTAVISDRPDARGLKAPASIARPTAASCLRPSAATSRGWWYWRAS
jgi:folate-dependent phosphoribosylglycinamide formyltransferase PurN